jgi:hypothetical protein
MIHVHTRWLGHRGGPVDSLEFLTGSPSLDQQWGRMWLTTVPDSADAVEERWIPGRHGAGHLVAIYEIAKDVIPAGVWAVGVASTVPVDTASVLAQIQGLLSQRGVSVTLVKADLSPQSLSHLGGCRIESIRFNAPDGYRLNQLSDPVDASRLAGLYGDDRVSAVTALLGRGDSHIVVNLFDDNQFYVADPQPTDIGEVAARISPLWGPRMPTCCDPSLSIQLVCTCIVSTIRSHAPHDASLDNHTKQTLYVVKFRTSIGCRALCLD